MKHPIIIFLEIVTVRSIVIISLRLELITPREENIYAVWWIDWLIDWLIDWFIEWWIDGISTNLCFSR